MRTSNSLERESRIKLVIRYDQRMQTAGLAASGLAVCGWFLGAVVLDRLGLIRLDAGGPAPGILLIIIAAIFTVLAYVSISIAFSNTLMVFAARDVILQTRLGPFALGKRRVFTHTDLRSIRVVSRVHVFRGGRALRYHLVFDADKRAVDIMWFNDPLYASALQSRILSILAEGSALTEA